MEEGRIREVVVVPIVLQLMFRIMYRAVPGAASWTWEAQPLAAESARSFVAERRGGVVMGHASSPIVRKELTP